MSALGCSKAPPSSAGGRSSELTSQTLRSSKNSMSHASTKCGRLWFPGKGIRNMVPRVSGLFYSTNLQGRLTWWKQPQNFVSKKVIRWTEHGVKVEFQKGLPFAPKPSAPKFVDPQDVDFAIQDLLKGRRIGSYWYISKFFFFQFGGYQD